MSLNASKPNFKVGDYVVALESANYDYSITRKDCILKVLEIKSHWSSNSNKMFYNFTGKLVVRSSSEMHSMPPLFPANKSGFEGEIYPGLYPHRFKKISKKKVMAYLL